MKLIIVAALLVASVAGQSSVDLLKLNRDSNSLLKYERPVVGNDILLRRRLLGHPLERSLIYGDNVEVPQYLRDDIVDLPVYELDEIVAHPLFRVYYTLPLFRQYWQYPMFQRYVASVYFQRFWQVPAFQQYFINPVLFYKYVYPLVTLFQYEQTATIPTTYNTVEDLIRNRNDVFVPFVRDQVYARDQVYNRDQVYAQSLLDRIYGHLNVNNVDRQGRLQGILTDVQLTTEGVVRDQTYGQIVDPITGEVRLTTGDVKLVNERIIPVDTSFPEQDNIFNLHRDQYNRIPTVNRINPLVARLISGYNYGRLPVVNRF